MSGTSRTSRLKPLRAALASFRPAGACLTGLILLHGPAFGAKPQWDCRVAPDGRGWQCTGDGIAVDVPPPDAPSAVEIQVPSPPPKPPVPAVDGAPETASQPMEQPAAELEAAAAAKPEPPEPEAQPEIPPTADTAKTPADRPAMPEAEQAKAAPPGPAPDEMPVAPVEPVPDEVAAPAKPATRPPATATTAPAAPAPQQAFETDASTMPDLMATEPSTTVVLTPAAEPKAAPTDAAEEAQRAAVDGVTTATSDIGETFTGGLDAGIDWQTCPAPRTVSRAELTTDTDTGYDQPIEISADAATGELAPERVLFRGNVELVQGALRISGEEISLDRESGELIARQGFQLSRPDVRIAGSTATYRLNTGTGTVEQAAYRIPAIRARGEAEHAAFLGAGLSEYRNISYSTCSPAQDDWLLEAEELELDTEEGLGTARHAKLRFLGVPLLYAPTFTFPIDDRRRSGLLVPSIGYSENTGADLSVPYYFNLAPDYDLTLTPRLMSKRGAMLGGEFRFLTESTEGELMAEFLPSDSEYSGSSKERGAVSFNSNTLFNARTDAEVRLNYVSDSDYLRDLGDSLAATSATHVERAGEINYHADTWDLLGRVQYYQTIDDTIATEDRPYSRLPQLKVVLEDTDGLAGTTYHLDAEYVNFHRDGSVRGHRLDLFPAVSLPLRNSWGFVEPKLGARYTAYRLDDQVAGFNDDPSTFTGMFSLDSGLYFDRNTDYFGSAVTQTLEPRLYYLYVPDRSQKDQPIFDTSPLDFSFDNLFRENRFNGPDRFGDANQVTLALTSRILSELSGAELLRASIGQIVYFEDRDVALPDEPTANDSSSAVAGELIAQLGGGWHSRAGLQWDPHDGDDGTIDQALAQVNYLGDEGGVFNAAYRLRDGVVQQTDLAFLWPVSPQLSLIGRHNHSLKDDRLLEALAGIEYGRCCWRIRALVRQYTDDEDDDHNFGVQLQLELNGLGRLGDDIDSTLERGIYGYRTNDED